MTPSLISLSSLVILALVALLLLFVIYSDIKFRIIPNAAILALAALFVPMGFLQPVAWLPHVLTFIVIFAITFTCFHFKWLGGGDAKLIPVIALWVGLEGIMPFLFSMTLGGLLVAVVLIVFHARRREKDGDWRKLKLPYGVAIAVAAMMVIGLQYGQPALDMLKGAA